MSRLAGRLFLVMLWVLVRQPAAAQSGYEIEVYGTNDMVLPGTLLIELHNSYVFRGQRLSSSGTGGTIIDDRAPYSMLQDPVCLDSNGPALARLPGSAALIGGASIAAALGCRLVDPGTTSHSVRELLEMSTGITSWLDGAFYLFGSRVPGSSATLDGEAYRVRVRVPESLRWPIGLGLSMEIDHNGGPAPQSSLEWRPIIDRAMGRWYLALNPTVERVLGGTARGVQFSPSGRLTYDVSRSFSGGLEYYGAFGQASGAATTAYPQQLFGTIDVHRWASWEVSVGVGVGMNAVSDRAVGKLVIGRRLSIGHDTTTI